MRTGRFRRTSLRALVLGAALVSLGVDASARIETLRWTHADPDEVAGFRVHVGSSSRVYSESIDVDLPPLSQGAYVFDLQVDDLEEVYVTVTAYDPDGLESFYSNEQCRGPDGPCQTAPEPDPDPTPDPSGPQAAIVGFALWDASTNTLIDSDFQSGEQIDLAAHDCVAIEIRGNSYLSSSAGSLRKSLDAEGTACTQAGVTHENSAPFAWEADSGPGSFECAASLTEPGAHTLWVTPFDGNNCSGEEGTTVTLDFEVVSDGSPPPPPPPPPELGVPGRPEPVLP